MKRNWMPEIYYEENNEGITSGLPFIKVPNDKLMPGCLFMCEVRDLKEKEEIEKEVTIHSFANMTLLKEKLNKKDYDKIRIALGFLPLNEASSKGKEITEKINKNINVN